MFTKTREFITLTKEYLFLIFMVIVFYAMMSILGHGKYPNIWVGILVVFSTLKVYLLVSSTFKKLDELTKNDHSFNHLLFLLGAVIAVIILSFTFDYLCLAEIYPQAFSGLENDQPFVYRLLDLLYFSIVTYTTVGYGDIAPVAPAAKLISVLEIMTAFVVIVFMLTKYFKNN